ncbi:hypothetical protein MY11210_006313 [Beauveria gryllotalpidicola]
MRDTKPQPVKATRLAAAAPFRPDSPRSRADQSQRSSSQHWNQYPPRTAETRRRRPSHPHCRHRPQQQPQRDVGTAPRTPPACKKVAFYGMPDSSGIGGGGAAHATGPAREHRRRQRQRQQVAAAAAKPGRSLAWRLSAALSLVQAVAARFGERNAKPTRPSESTTTRATWGSVMALVSTAGSVSHRSGDCTVTHPPAARLLPARRTRPGSVTTARGQEQAARPSPTRIPAPTGRPAYAHRRRHTPVRHRGRYKRSRNEPPYPIPPRRYTLINTHDDASLETSYRFCRCPCTAQQPDRERAGHLARDAVAKRPCRGSVARKYWV